ncbi:MAG: nucleoside triphosphate pyrophosphohydrolase [Proteobacteria bacterium]|nr:MAG: nucleoside triphosphate pyrophosphohydrolase [Pseudomonadota bacterium]
MNYPHHDIRALLTVMARLRDPKTGCPWDREQDFRSIAPYTIEEAYEVADAIEREAPEDLKEELGDLLLQVVYHARMAEEASWFEFSDVVQSIVDKMIRRHPHVFGDEQIADAATQTEAWEQHKAREKPERDSVLDGVTAALPALTRSVKLQRRAARVGFDWPSPHPVFDKIAEELEEVRHELSGDNDLGRITDEMGDLLFACTNLSRHLGVDPETALRYANRKFERRFRFIETDLRQQGRAPVDTPLAELDALWEAAKRADRRAK